LFKIKRTIDFLKFSNILINFYQKLEDNLAFLGKKELKNYVETLFEVIFPDLAKNFHNNETILKGQIAQFLKFL
jgi:hypothetical protein